MLTIRESSWLTDNTYAYEEVVKMMAELLGAFRGDIQVRHRSSRERKHCEFHDCGLVEESTLQLSEFQRSYLELVSLFSSCSPAGSDDQ